MQINLPSILLSDYFYQLPNELIALYPLSERQNSRLLVYHGKESSVTHKHFHEITEFIPENCLLVRNSSRVLHARLQLYKPSGGAVEVLLTQPSDATLRPEVALHSTKGSAWKCLIGGKGVVGGSVLSSKDATLTATVLSKKGSEAVVQLDSNSGKPLTTILMELGFVPLPPYIKREMEAQDVERYQTVYASEEGSVAAPTAGLHFTDEVVAQLVNQGVEMAQVVLHVGLGTFKTVDEEDVRNHVMHEEQFEISKDCLLKMLTSLETGRHIVAVGTTSVRTLESVHWLGASLCVGRKLNPDFVEVGQWSAFDPELLEVSPYDSISALMKFLQRNSLSGLWGSTKLILAPGARIALVNALITNFHHPGNTLLLLVAAFVGKEEWKKIYGVAIKEKYRFLSYGDSSLLVRG